MMAKVSKNAWTRSTTIRKNVVGEIRGKTIVQKRLAGPAPSINVIRGQVSSQSAAVR